MPRNRGHKASVDVAESERNHGRETRKGSRGKHTGRAPNEAARRRPQDLDTGADDQSASPRLLVTSTSSGAQGPERAVKASDRSKSSKVLRTAEIQADRQTPSVDGSDPDTADSNSSISDSDSSTSDSDSSTLSLPDPYDGRPDQLVFDKWVSDVKAWASLEKLSRKDVMYLFPLLVTGEAEVWFRLLVLSPWSSRKWRPKQVFELLQKLCFPYDHQLRLYEQLTSVKQGNRRVIEYAEEVRFLAGHLPHVSKKFLGLVFWAGLNPRIQNALTRMPGIGPGCVRAETLIRLALKLDSASRGGLKF